MMAFFLCLAAAVATTGATRIALSYFQLESYQLGGYARSLRRNLARAFAPGAVVAVCASAWVAFWLGQSGDRWAFIVSALGFIALGLGAWFFSKRIKAKKPLVITIRVKRLITITFLVHALLAFFLAFVVKTLSLVTLLPLFAPFTLAVAAVCALPMEKGIQALYRRDAMKKLDGMKGLIKIGITGSYGKTSTKFMLATILREKYRVLATRASFNTSMGVTRVIREELTPDVQVFIAEMGTRHPGDIRLLCKIVRPRYGILTSVGPQHLETFGSQEAIVKEKFTLAQAIPDNGAMVFASDDGLCEALFNRFAGVKHLSGQHTAGLGLTAQHIEVGVWGSRFALVYGSERVQVETKLLGAHNIDNLLAAATLARVMGLTLEEIARGMGKVEPVEHRLQLLSGAGGIVIIDDAFNANPVGAAEALKTLSAFSGRRIVVTPGFVELGAREAELNRALGKQIAVAVDLCVLVGKKHTQPIAEGVLQAGFPKENLSIFDSLQAATAWLSPELKPGDTVLYENDLPDNYGG